MYLQFFSDFYGTLPFNYDSPVPEGGMREGGRNGSVIRWSWGGWRSSRAYHMIREGSGRGGRNEGYSGTNTHLYSEGHTWRWRCGAKK